MPDVEAVARRQKRVRARAWRPSATGAVRSVVDVNVLGPQLQLFFDVINTTPMPAAPAPAEVLLHTNHPMPLPCTSPKTMCLRYQGI